MDRIPTWVLALIVIACVVGIAVLQLIWQGQIG